MKTVAGVAQPSKNTGWARVFALKKVSAERKKGGINDFDLVFRGEKSPRFVCFLPCFFQNIFRFYKFLIQIPWNT